MCRKLLKITLKNNKGAIMKLRDMALKHIIFELLTNYEYALNSDQRTLLKTMNSLIIK